MTNKSETFVHDSHLAKLMIWHEYDINSEQS